MVFLGQSFQTIQFSFIYSFSHVPVCCVTIKCVLGTKCYSDFAEDKHFRTMVPAVQELVVITVMFVIDYTAYSAY